MSQRSLSEPLCKICNLPTHDLPDLQFRIDYHHCTLCEYIFMDESVLVSPEEEKTIYLQHENTPDNEGYMQMFNDFIKWAIVPHADHVKTALDFGCGPGPVLASILQKHGYRTEVYDPYFAENPENLSKTYDLITATEVLEHLIHPMVELKKLVRILNPNGIMAVMTLFHPNDTSAFQDWWYRRDPTHIGFFTPITLKKMAGLLGLELIDHDDKRIAVFQKRIPVDTVQNEMEITPE
ncbi:class I SAM-dependent methyltransferase [candidate division KSB1 bacterium]|nr:class I SAM-dependent methyltransferase [candidate division KSB1 bacterium]